MLHFLGRDYPFTIAGVGVGGVGASRFDGSGGVYNLASMANFAGPHARIRTGLAIGQHGNGKLMLRNAKGVIMRLSGTNKGFALSTGAGAIVITFVQ